MANDPKYVRLAPRLQNGMVCDVYNSGWSISGLDVRKFPENQTAARFVRAQVNSGVLEACSKAEWDDAHDETLEQEVLSQVPDYREKASAVQESRIQKVAQEASAKLREKAGADEEAEYQEALEADREDREERLREAKEAGLDSDDPEEQKARSTGQKPRKGSKAAAKKAAASEE